MANFSDLIEQINTTIIDNDEQLISGGILNQVLNDMVTAYKEELDKVNKAIQVLSTPVNINIKGSVSSLDSLPANPSAGDLYFVNSDEYVWSGTEWISLGPAVALNNRINVVIPENTQNGLSLPLPGYTYFNIDETDINNLKDGIIGSVNIIDNRNKLNGEPTYAIGEISYNSYGSVGYGNLSISYIYNGKQIIYDIELHYTYAKVYVTEK